MFSGIIESIGKIIDIKLNNNNSKILIIQSDIISQHKYNIGDSISINGACHTMYKINEDSIEVYSSNETLSITNLGDLKVNDYINLESPLTINKFINGHIVEGHIEGIGYIKEILKKDTEWEIFIQLDNLYNKNLIRFKGSICIDGTSLTINQILNNKSIKLTIIPHTIKNTIIKNYKVGTKVNIEYDLISKNITNYFNLPNK